jgi:hypothetical protein
MTYIMIYFTSVNLHNDLLHFVQPQPTFGCCCCVCTNANNGNFSVVQAEFVLRVKLLRQMNGSIFVEKYHSGQKAAWIVCILWRTKITVTRFEYSTWQWMLALNVKEEKWRKMKKGRQWSTDEYLLQKPVLRAQTTTPVLWKLQRI